MSVFVYMRVGNADQLEDSRKKDLECQFVRFINEHGYETASVYSKYKNPFSKAQPKLHSQNITSSGKAACPSTKIMLTRKGQKKRQRIFLDLIRNDKKSKKA